MPTSKTRKPAAAKKTVSSKADFKKASAKKKVELELPSGPVVMVRRVPLTKLLEMDIFPDSLEAIVAEKTGAADKDQDKPVLKKPDVKEAGSLLANPEELQKLMVSVDRITAMVLREPAVVLAFTKVEDAEGNVTWQEIPEEERDEDELYTDELDMQDKFFLFQFTVGGSSDLDAFRAEFGETLGALGDGESLPDQAE